jgi:hypothetical protein
MVQIIYPPAGQPVLRPASVKDRVVGLKKRGEKDISLTWGFYMSADPH